MSANPSEDNPVIGQGYGEKRIKLIGLAMAQRSLLWCVLGRVFLDTWAIWSAAQISGWNPRFYFVGLGVGVVVTSVFIAKVAVAYGQPRALGVVGGLFSSVPGLGLFTLGLLNERVNKTIKAAGCSIGLMGVSNEELSKLRLGACRSCGYDLRGLSSDICPECGVVQVKLAPVPSYCSGCGYDLSGSRCDESPECGRTGSANALPGQAV